MSLIPFRMKRSTGMEPSSLTTMGDFRNEMNRLLEGFLNRPLTGQSWHTRKSSLWPKYVASSLHPLYC